MAEAGGAWDTLASLSQSSGSSASSCFPQALVSLSGRYCDLSGAPDSGEVCERGDISCLPSWADLRSRWAEHVRRSILLLPHSRQQTSPAQTTPAQGEYGKALRVSAAAATCSSRLPAP